MMEELGRGAGFNRCTKKYTFIYKLFLRLDFMRRSNLFLFLFVIFILTFSVSSLDFKDSVTDYFGTLEYSSNLTYYFYINQTSETITFAGLNESNFNHYIQIPFDSSHNFNVRINYVWYHGWFDAKYLYVDEFVPAGIFYSNLSTEISNGTYWNQFFLEEIPFLNITNVTVNATVKKNINRSSISLIEYGLNSTSDMILLNDTLVASHIYLPMLLETRLFGLNNLELHLWIKDDFNGVSLDPHWTSILHSVDGETIQLLYPENNLEIKTTSTDSQVEFTFFVNKSLFSPKDVPYCLIYVNDDNGLFEINSTFNESNWHGKGNSILSLGDYDWNVLCKDSLKSIQSDSLSFRIIQFIPIGEEEEKEEEGRRRKSLSPENVSNNTIQLANNSRGNPLSLITGAVIGVFGEKGAFIIGLLFIILGLVALVVYNREHFGLIKKDHKI